jgi:hypothetical protein
MFLELFHGRTDPDQQMDDWGSSGPIFEIDSVQFTYGWHIKLYTEHNESMEELVVNNKELVHYDGVFYGDLCIFTGELAEDQRARLQKFDKAKSTQKGK